MAHRSRSFDLSGLDGISDEQIAAHCDVLYAGYVKKLNEIEDRLKGVDMTAANQVFSELRALKAEETFALNGVVLHELYFENLCGGSGREAGGSGPSGSLLDLMVRDFGGVERWSEEFEACGMAARGWVIMGLCGYDGRLHNYCLDSHNFNFPALNTPLLVMDVYEHAYGIDYGVKRPPYIEAFMRNIAWSAVEERFEKSGMKEAARAVAD